MKISEPIQVAGLYLQNDGNWQSSSILTNGENIFEVTLSELSKSPPSRAAKLTGVECAQGLDLPMDILADRLRGPVVSDFRSSDIAMGGQGGPLYAFYLHALAGWMGAEPLAFLVLEDAVTLVWVDPRVVDPTDPRAIVYFETGPCLGPLEGIQTDDIQGDVVDGALELFLDDPYFRKLPPKWVERASFAQLLELVWELSPPDAQATLLGMSATSVLLALEHLPEVPDRFVVVGTGAKNALLIQLLRAALDSEVAFLDPLIDGQTLQAQAIAYLAARVAKGLPTTAPHTTGVAAAVGGGNLTDFS